MMYRATSLSRATRFITFGLLSLFMMTTTISASSAQAVDSSSSTSASASGTSACSAEIASQFNSLLGLVNDNLAVRVAEESAQFVTAVGGSAYQLVTVYGIGAYSPGTCGADMTLGQVIVAFTLDSQTVTSGNVTVPVGISVFENPQLSAVSSVTVDRSIFMLANWFSGYEASYSTNNIYSSEMTIDVPSVSSNSNCYHASPYACVMSPWSAIDNANGYLVQEGLNINITCTSGSSCGSEKMGAFWEYLAPSGGGVPAEPCNSNSYPVSLGDQVTSYEANGLFTGGDGNSNYYIMSVQDSTAAWVCQPSWQDVGTASTNRGLSIIETPANGCCPIPINWNGASNDVLDMTSNILCPTTSTSGCVYFSASGVTRYTDSMYNYCTADQSYVYNIDVGSMQSGGDYTQTYGTNCDF